MRNGDGRVYTIRGMSTLLCSLDCADCFCDAENIKSAKVRAIPWNISSQSIAAQCAMERACCDSCGIEIGDGARGTEA